MPLVIVFSVIGVAASLLLSSTIAIKLIKSDDSQTHSQEEQTHIPTSQPQTDDPPSHQQTHGKGTHSHNHHVQSEVSTKSQRPKIPSVPVLSPFSSNYHNSTVVSYEKKYSEPEEEPEKRPGFRIEEDKNITISLSDDSEKCDIKLGCNYVVYQEEYYITYYFEPGSKCIEIKYKNESVWSYDNKEHLKCYPERMHFSESILLLTVYFNNRWYYGYIYRWQRWDLGYEIKLMRPGSLVQLLKHVFDIDLTLSPSLIRHFSRMRIRTLGFLSGFHPGLDKRVKLLIDRLYNSELSSESLPEIVKNPDKVHILLRIINGTPLKLSENGLDLLISDPPLLIHLIEELKSIGFSVDVLLKKLLESPEKLDHLLFSLRGLGYKLSEKKIHDLKLNKKLLTYLNVTGRVFHDYTFNFNV